MARDKLKKDSLALSDTKVKISRSPNLTSLTYLALFTHPLKRPNITRKGALHFNKKKLVKYKYKIEMAGIYI